jgi:hypothetical protein
VVRVVEGVVGVLAHVDAFAMVPEPALCLEECLFLEALLRNV